MKDMTGVTTTYHSARSILTEDKSVSEQEEQEQNSDDADKSYDCQNVLSEASATKPVIPFAKINERQFMSMEQKNRALFSPNHSKQ